MILMLLALALPLQMGGPGGMSGYSSPLPPDSFVISSLQPDETLPAGACAFVRFDFGLDKSQSVVLRAFGLADGSYDFVRLGSEGWEPLGSFVVQGDGQGKLVPQPPFGGTYLDWFLYGSLVAVRQGGEIQLWGYLEPLFSFSFSFDDSSMLNGARLIAVGHDLDARGRLVFKSAADARNADLRLERLDPGPYIVDIGGEPAVYLVAGPGGSASLKLASPLQSGAGLLSFSSKGQEVRVRNAAGEVVLAAQMPDDPYSQHSRPPGRQKVHDLGDGAADGLSIDFIQTHGSDWGGLKQGTLAWQRDALGNASVSVQVVQQKYPPFYGPYTVFVGDTELGALDDGSDEDDPLQATFALAPGIDLRGQRIEVREGSYARLALICPQSLPAALRAYRKDVRQPHRLRLDLLNPGTDLDATGRLDWRSTKGVEQLQLQVHDLPAGSYDLALDGVVVAADALLVAENGGEATLLFSTGGALPDSLPLDFAVQGALEIRAAGGETVYLQQDLAH